jgi:AraC-like DNA-binding protein
LSGTGKLMATDPSGTTNTFSVKSMQGFMIFPNQITTYVADQILPWEYIWIEFDGLRAKSILESSGITSSDPIYRARSKKIREDMVTEMKYIIQNNDVSSLHLIGHLYLFLDYLVQSAANMTFQSGSSLRDFYIHEALSYIEHNFQNDITVEDIADSCGLNRSYFGKIFKSAIGKSPQEFLLNYRMLKAAELLKLTKLSISDISNAVGYVNPLHFSRAFKNIYGIPPRDWRNQNKIIRTTP